ncbi:MAG TPA: hypothetical protein VIP11_21575, partial [Gemmatimonadaceae bacterium]
MRSTVCISLSLLAATSLFAQNPTRPRRDSVVTAALGPRNAYRLKTSRADTLRGSFTTPGRNWWDVSFYDLHVDIRPAD